MNERVPKSLIRNDATRPGGGTPLRNQGRSDTKPRRFGLWFFFSVAFAALCVLVIQPSVPAANPITSAVINEFVFNHTGTDVFEFVEVFGDPDTDYSQLTILEIEGDATVAGMIDGVFPVGTTDGAGFWTTGFMSNIIENGSVTLLLVMNFSGSVGDDLDVDNDGVLDDTPWDLIIDDVAVTDGGSNDRMYSSVVLAPGFDGNPFTVGGASRIPNGTDTDSVGDWLRNDFDGEGLPDFVGTPSVGEALNTPGSTNEPVTPAPDPMINEFVANHVGPDTLEFVEVFGDPNTNYSRFFILEIEGDGVNSGRIDGIYRVGTTDGGGFWTTAFQANQIENGSMTLLLVENFFGFIGQDLDTDNDGIMDVMPFGRNVDDVAVLNGGASDWVYSSVALTAGFDGDAFLPGGASRIPNGTDTDSVGDWLRNDYDGEGLPGFVGTPVYGEAINTPGAINEPVADTTPPVITVDLNRTALWPPNHKMADICATVTVTDNADPAPTFVLTSVMSSEPDNGKGDGNTTNDIQGADIGTPDLCFQLRAERQGGGNGREYTIVYTATDFSGNSASMTVAVRVPHDQSGMAMASVGFISDGTAFDESFDRFALVIPSRLAKIESDEDRNLVVVREGYDAAEIDVHHIYVGNTNGALRPEESRVLDVDGDGLEDLAVFYSVAATLDLQSTVSTENTNEGRLGRRSSAGPIGLHYESRDGTECLVSDIFDLGGPVTLLSQTPLTSPDEAKRDSHETPGITAPVTVYPNPFNPATTISFELTGWEEVSLRIFDVRGKLVRTLKNENLGPGRHEIDWDGRDNHGIQVASGIYLVRLESASCQVTRKAVMLK